LPKHEIPNEKSADDVLFTAYCSVDSLWIMMY